MTTDEMRELDAWIAENVMGETLGKKPPVDDVVYEDSERKFVKGLLKRYTTDPASAMEVLKKCVEKFPVEIYIGNFDKGRCRIKTDYDFDMTGGQADTLELAISLFAKNLFTKNLTNK